ncbi:16S rRNA (adenine(1518)-N(6)/adenine(1519)-N(6))-dimethyltransferase RsmA [Candidatus Spongiihabitans sp.]|uniref:16S rRNA (adenine(1518)-N(6)/adenine(1519)-N(6))- dimethyltransferase RsmA n=1 Tax=Candidatus Spongiihabitans sp. TaxID=3101308 RepID=UPI003C79A471
MTPRKRFGQHFLTDENVLERIVNVFHPADNELVLEIGPGSGALTERLLDRIGHLTVVELDRDLAATLSEKYDSDRLTLFQSDILNFEIASVFNCSELTGNVPPVISDDLKNETSNKVRIIGNLPYNISTPLLFHLLKSVEHIQDMLFMLQKEVAQRLSAAPGSKIYGRLSVMAALELDCQCLFDVPPQAFDPPPEVESTVIRLTPTPLSRAASRHVRDRIRLNEIVKLAFSQRRKTLRNSLQSIISAQQFKNARVDSSRRAENLTVNQFIQLSNA